MKKGRNWLLVLGLVGVLGGRFAVEEAQAQIITHADGFLGVSWESEWVNPMVSVGLDCPFQTFQPGTAFLGPAHTGIFTRTSGAGDQVDVWWYGPDQIYAVVRPVGGGWYEGYGTIGLPSFKKANLSLYDASGVERGNLLLCADPAPYRVPSSSKEVIQNGCDMLSIGFEIQGQISRVALFSRTMQPPRKAECFR